MDTRVDVLMITSDRAVYTRRSLPHLLEACDERARVFLWHNGDDAETLEVVREYARHPRVARFEHSAENRVLNEPTNWFWEQADAELLGKVDDDCLVPEGWLEAMRAGHAAEARFGALTCWHLGREDLVDELVQRKLRSYGGQQIMQNCWVNGSGYVIKRACIDEQGPLREGQNWTGYCLQLALRGWIHGWLHPFLFEEHMDDPRSPYTRLRTDEDVERYAPLSARANGVTTLEAWRAQLERSAQIVQRASIDPRRHVGLRRRLAPASLKRALLARLGVKRKW